MSQKIIRSALISILILGVLGCQGMAGGGGGGGEVQGNVGGTSPINQKEAVEYQRAILKCYKTGGTRIVKISGELRCY